MAVLRSNFVKVTSGAEKIDRGEFAIQDTATKREIDLSRDWEVCFLPGQKVDMSMIFSTSKDDGSTCPSCGENSTRGVDEDVEW